MTPASKKGERKYRSERNKRRILVTGDRKWDDQESVDRFLDKVNRWQDVEVVQGGAMGADQAAKHWATRNKRPVQTFAADWRKYGRAAGPKRNQQMLDEGQPHAVMAFHRNLAESKGTKDMVRRARKAGLPVMVWPDRG